MTTIMVPSIQMHIQVQFQTQYLGLSLTPMSFVGVPEGILPAPVLSRHTALLDYYLH